MEEILKSVINNPWYILATFIGTIASIIGIPIAGFIYYKQKKERIPLYMRRKENLFAENVEMIEYDGIPLEGVEFLKYALWNEGRETIRQEDIPQKDVWGLLCVNETRLLQAAIVYQDNFANNFGVEIVEDGRICAFKFDYLDYREVVVIQLLCKGEIKDVTFCGGVKGAEVREIRPIFEKLGFRNTTSVAYQKFEKNLKRLCAVLTTVMLGVFLIYFNLNPFKNFLLVFLLSLITFGVVSFLSWGGIWLIFKLYFKKHLGRVIGLMSLWLPRPHKVKILNPCLEQFFLEDGRETIVAHAPGTILERN